MSHDPGEMKQNNVSHFPTVRHIKDNPQRLQLSLPNQEERTIQDGAIPVHAALFLCNITPKSDLAEKPLTLSLFINCK